MNVVHDVGHYVSFLHIGSVKENGGSLFCSLSPDIDVIKIS